MDTLPTEETTNDAEETPVVADEATATETPVVEEATATEAPAEEATDAPAEGGEEVSA